MSFLLFILFFQNDKLGSLTHIYISYLYILVEQISLIPCCLGNSLMNPLLSSSWNSLVLLPRIKEREISLPSSPAPSGSCPFPPLIFSSSLAYSNCCAFPCKYVTSKLLQKNYFEYQLLWSITQRSKAQIHWSIWELGDINHIHLR